MSARTSSIAVAALLLSIGMGIAAFIYQKTTQVREALAEEILEQQHDVSTLIQEYGNVLVAIEHNRLSDDEASVAAMKSSVAAAQDQLAQMRSNYSFARLDGAAKAHAYVKPIIEDISQWTTNGLHGYQGDDHFILELSSKRMRDRFPAIRSISTEITAVATELITEQTEFLERFRDSLLLLLFGFVWLSVAIAALLIRQRNLQTQLAKDQETNAQKLIDAETRGRLQAETALLGSEQFLRATLNSLNSDIAILDKDGIVTAVNTPWKTFVSSTRSSYTDGGVGHHYAAVFRSTAVTDEERDGIAEAIKQITEVLDGKKEVMFYEYPCHRKEKRQWSLVSMYTFYTDEDRYAVLVHEDVSRRKQLEERDQRLRAELAHASRLSTAGELASGLAHELNQPLTAIAHNCDAVVSSIRTYTDIDAELVETVNDISEQAHRAGGIIRSMRHLVRKDTSDKLPTDINELVRETVRLTAPEARAKGVKVILRLTDSLPSPTIDPVQIQQVLVNLERNSVEAMGQHNSTIKELTIDTYLNQTGHIEVCITDTGPGIDPGFAEHLFTAFQTTKPEGMGLGLSISRTIVEEHGGRLWIDQNEEDVTMFKFTIPAG